MQGMGLRSSIGWVSSMAATSASPWHRECQFFVTLYGNMVGYAFDVVDLLINLYIGLIDDTLVQKSYWANIPRIEVCLHILSWRTMPWQRVSCDGHPGQNSMHLVLEYQLNMINVCLQK